MIWETKLILYNLHDRLPGALSSHRTTPEICDHYTKDTAKSFEWLWNLEFCSKFRVLDQDSQKILRNLEHLELGITFALYMVETSCLVAEIWWNEDAINFFLENKLCQKLGWQILNIQLETKKFSWFIWIKFKMWHFFALYLVCMLIFQIVWCKIRV